MRHLKIALIVTLISLFARTKNQSDKQEIIELSETEYHNRVKAMWVAQLVAVHIGWDTGLHGFL